MQNTRPSFIHLVLIDGATASGVSWAAYVLLYQRRYLLRTNL